MRVWDLERGTIWEFAKAMASENGALNPNKQRQLLLAAFWRGELPATNAQGSVIAPEQLCNMACLFDNRWHGATLLEVTRKCAGKSLGDVLRKLYRTLNPETLARMVNGYPPPEIPEHQRVPTDSDEPSPLPDILVDGEPTKLKARLHEGGLISLPAVEPFVSKWTCDDFAALRWQDYTPTFRSTCLAKLCFAPKTVRAWQGRVHAGNDPPPAPMARHEVRVALLNWYRDVWVGEGAWRDWLRNGGCDAANATPSEADDVAAAKANVSKSVSRAMVRPYRRQFGLPEWHTSGRRKKA